MEPLFLTLAEVLEIHDQQIQLYGGSSGIRDHDGLESAVTFLWLNGWEPTFDADQMIDLVLGLASGQMDKTEITEFFEANSRPSESAF